jgi:hypothetical protein
MRQLIWLIALLLSLPAPTAHADESQGAVQFPLVFTSKDPLSNFGLSIGSAKQPPLLHSCYYYGDGGDLITVSHERLLRYRDMGFTLNSLCLGLMSETLFDPETGKRLPTFIVIDADAAASSGTIRGNDTTYEHPLELPRCFRRALPYSDCVFNFDRLTGQPLSEDKKLAFQALGKSLNEAFERAIKERLVCSWPFCTERRSDCCVVGSLAAGGAGPAICSNEGYLPYFIESELAPHGIDVPKPLLDGSHLSCFDVSINLPAGYGYAMDADGTAGPSVSPEVIKAALDSKHRVSQIDPATLAAELQAFDKSQGTGGPAQSR